MRVLNSNMTFILPLPKATDLFIISFYFSHSSYHCQVKSALVLMQIVRKNMLLNVWKIYWHPNSAHPDILTFIKADWICLLNFFLKSLKSKKSVSSPVKQENKECIELYSPEPVQRRFWFHWNNIKKKKADTA